MQTLKEAMGLLKLDEIVQVTGGRVLCGNAQIEFSGLSTDSRTIKNGELFIALKGVHFDGHYFVNDALKEGAGALVSIPPSEPGKGKTIIYVKNTLNALHDIARSLRLKLKVPVIGITGTNGKTSTKEIIATVLGRGHKVLKTLGNLNNHIGLPLSISRMNGDETVMVLEMGSSASGDIEQLCEIAYPDYAVVTNVAPAHLEGFGSYENVRKTDLEILEYAKVVAVNADDRFLCDGLKDYKGKIITYGIENNADVSAKDIVLTDRGSYFILGLSHDRYFDVDLKIPGRFNIYNALAAASITAALGISQEDIKHGMESFQGVPMRLEFKDFQGALVLYDVYNANPASMEETLKELIRLKRKRTIAVLGDMLELGSYTAEAHKRLISVISELNIDVLIAVGPEMTKASSEFKGECYTAEDSLKAQSIISNICGEGDTVLLKGSRTMRMERVFNDYSGREEGHAL